MLQSSCTGPSLMTVRSPGHSRSVFAIPNMDGLGLFGPLPVLSFCCRRPSLIHLFCRSPQQHSLSPPFPPAGLATSHSRQQYPPFPTHSPFRRSSLLFKMLALPSRILLLPGNPLGTSHHLPGQYPLQARHCLPRLHNRYMANRVYSLSHARGYSLAAVIAAS